MYESARELSARYRKLRASQRDLNRVLSAMLPDNAIAECGTLLGVSGGGFPDPRSRTEMSVLMEYCLYDYRWDGQNAIERYVSQTPIEAGSDRSTLLDAMLQPRYSLFAVDDVTRGLGVQTHDLFRGDSGFIVDTAFSETAVKGMVLASRIISPDHGRLSMTTGASLPVDRPILKRIIQEGILERFSHTTTEILQMPAEKAAQFSAHIIRICLEEDASSRMTYVASTAGRQHGSGYKIGRNESCPCGSGRKYKVCCGRGTWAR